MTILKKTDFLSSMLHVVSVIHSCKTLEQLDICREWARVIYNTDILYHIDIYIHAKEQKLLHKQAGLDKLVEELIK